MSRFLWTLFPCLYIKEHSPKRKSEIRIGFWILSLQNGQKLFWAGQRIFNFCFYFCFSLVLALTWCLSIYLYCISEAGLGAHLFTCTAYLRLALVPIYLPVSISEAGHGAYPSTCTAYEAGLGAYPSTVPVQHIWGWPWGLSIYLNSTVGWSVKFFLNWTKQVK